MWFLIEQGTYKIFDATKEQKEVYAMILNTLNQITAQPNNHCLNFDKVEKEGCYFTRKDNEIELRKYKFTEGYLYNGLEYEEIAKFFITEFSSISVNQFLIELKKEISEKFNEKKNKPKTVSKTVSKPIDINIKNSWRKAPVICELKKNTY